MRTYPKSRSKVSITYKDGHVQDVEISASHYILRHLIRESRETGTIMLRDDDAKRSWLIPIENVLNIELVDLPLDGEVLDAPDKN